MTEALPKDLFNHIRRLQIITTRQVNNLFAGAYRSAFKGVGLELEGIRQYQPGDEIHHIDWHTTARVGRPYVKVFREERELTVIITVDISSSTRFSSTKQLKNEIIAEIGAILAFSAIKNNDKVGLLLFSDEVELYLKPKKGIRHVLRVIREILFFAPKHSGTNLKKALSFLGKIQKKHAICFLISDFMTADFEKDAVVLSKRHELIFIEIYDAFEQTFPRLGHVYVQDLESSNIHLIDTNDAKVQQTFISNATERRNQLKQLIQRIGASYIPIRTDASYSEALRKFFKMRRKRH